MHPGHPVVSQQQEGILTAEARAERGCRDCRRNLARDRTMLWPAWWPLCSREVFHPESGSNESEENGRLEREPSDPYPCQDSAPDEWGRT